VLHKSCLSPHLPFKASYCPWTLVGQLLGSAWGAALGTFSNERKQLPALLLNHCNKANLIIVAVLQKGIYSSCLLCALQVMGWALAVHTLHWKTANLPTMGSRVSAMTPRWHWRTRSTFERLYQATAYWKSTPPPLTIRCVCMVWRKAVFAFFL